MQTVVAGQGYVGLSLAVRAAGVGLRVVGYDVDPRRIERLIGGESYVQDVTAAQLCAVLVGFDIAVIAVPTPLGDGVLHPGAATLKTLPTLFCRRR
ncbi:hypothetical protein [Streptomyces sp. 4F14]|uniref:hypothetical protein n=1 Tax=Streptomyces sp. 4F14 TaxID=3394380 RepID=UPI003A85AD18